MTDNNLNQSSQTNQIQHRGRPRVENKKQFRNVAVPMEIHFKIKALADLNQRSIAKQLQCLIEQSFKSNIENEVI